MKWILLLDSLIWLRSSYGKFLGGNFVEGLPKTLASFASKNPYPWFKSFLTDTAIPTSNIFGNLVLYGELLSGLGIIIGVLLWCRYGLSGLGKLILITSLLGASLLNLNFWLASSWTSASTDSLNLLMLGIQIIGIVTVIKSKRG